MSTVLVVCTGNICRSPLLEGLLRHLLSERGVSDIRVESAGVSGWDGSEASVNAVEAIRERGIDISGHRARQLLPSHLESADLVLALAAEHREAIVELSPAVAARTFTLKELIHLLRRLPQATDEPDPATRLESSVAAAAALRAAGEEPAIDEDVEDPIGRGLESYRATTWELETLSRHFVDLVFGGVTAGRRA